MMKFFALLNARQLAFKNAFNGLLPDIFRNLIWAVIFGGVTSVVIEAVVFN
jgi:hypothetical protein